MTVQEKTAQSEVPEGVYALPVTDIRHYTDRLFFFRTERPDGFRFRSGEFVMIGLPPEVMGGKTIWRAYSIASPAWEEHVDFYSIKVPDGPLTSKLMDIEVGDTVWMRKKPTGTLVHDALVPGKRLFLLCTGTGIAPFASIIRDPETYEKFEKVYVIHTCRDNAELQYGFDLVDEIANHEILAEIVGDKLVHWASCTREEADTGKGVHAGRMTDLMRSGALYEELGIEPLNPETCRVMICGSMAMLKDCANLCEEAGLAEGSNSEPGQYVIERAFVG
ncbi:MAG: ferredoxin--NADP reductase [Nitratireductor sp.]|nr:ferredoxin--NADP reductase [Nitratireductor sp.]